MIHQIELGVRQILKVCKKSNSKAFICGHSAGAHLAAMMLYANFNSNEILDENLAGLYLVSGVFDLTPLTQTSVNDALGLNIDSAKDVSPYFKENIGLSDECIKKIKISITYGEYDSPAFKEQSKNFEKVNNLKLII